MFMFDFAVSVTVHVVPAPLNDICIACSAEVGKNPLAHVAASSYLFTSVRRSLAVLKIAPPTAKHATPMLIINFAVSAGVSAGRLAQSCCCENALNAGLRDVCAVVCAAPAIARESRSSRIRVAECGIRCARAEGLAPHSRAWSTRSR